MAKRFTKPQAVVKSDYPSDFGSHKSMVDDDYIDINSVSDKFVVCKDNHGSYVTRLSNLDSGFTDYNRSRCAAERDEILQEYIQGNQKNVL